MRQDPAFSREEAILRIGFYNFLAPFIFLVFHQGFTAFFNPELDLTMWEKFLFSLKPTVYILFLVLALVSWIVLLRLLGPLFRFADTGEDYDHARTAALRVPWFLLSVHTGFWIVGTIIFYGIYNWVAPGGVPLIWSLAILIAAGFVSGIIAALQINNYIIRAKVLLNMVDIRENEYDLFARYKDVFTWIGYSAMLCIYYLYFSRNYYFQAGEEGLYSGMLVSGLVCGVFFIFVALVLIYLNKRDFHAQINILRTKLRDLAEGEGDLSQRAILINFDELGELCMDINEFVDYYTQLLNTIKSTIGELSSSVHSLSASSVQNSATSNEQAASVKEVLTTMEDSDRLSRDVAIKVDEVSAIANQTREQVERGSGTLEKNLSKMEEIRETNAGTISGVRNLSEMISTIWDIVTIINGIADQTKIIAFNAELEASAAGSAGKNFEIVASEIRRLADNTMSSTGEIKSKIDEIQKASDNLIVASEQGTRTIDEGWHLTRSLDEIFSEILTSAEVSANSASRISTSIGQQVQSFEQVLRAVKQISEGIDSYSESTDATKEAADTLKEMAESLNQLVGKYINLE
ncbi:MAG: methyl-accepting chemotaxis protein [Spirochaetia bacterium]